MLTYFTMHHSLQALAKVVSQRLGGPDASESALKQRWCLALQARQRMLGGCSAVALLGTVTVGSSRHRALMFKVLADALGMRCRLIRGRCEEPWLLARGDRI